MTCHFSVLNLCLLFGFLFFFPSSRIQLLHTQLFLSSLFFLFSHTRAHLHHFFVLICFLCVTFPVSCIHDTHSFPLSSPAPLFLSLSLSLSLLLLPWYGPQRARHSASGTLAGVVDVVGRARDQTPKQDTMNESLTQV